MKQEQMQGKTSYKSIQGGGAEFGESYIEESVASPALTH